jgi:O-antigen ligase
MRFYFWDAAIRVIKKYPVVGVGTGDVQLALNQVYSSGDSPLNAEWYKRPHNQFLTVTVALGFVGLLAMLFSIIYPLVLLRKHLHILFWPFLILALVSFMLEDTLETQAGLSFYAVFNSLFISFAYFKKESANSSQNT